MIWDSDKQMMDDDYCQAIGRSVSLDDLERADLYPPENALFYTPIPFMKNNVMSRLFHFLITDMGLNFKTSAYPRSLMGKNFIDKYYVFIFKWTDLYFPFFRAQPEHISCSSFPRLS